MGKYIRGNIDEFLALVTLGGKTVVADPFDDAVNERTLISSIVATYSLRNFTPATDDGPIMIGVAHSDYSAAEIEEYIENTGSWDEGNKVSQEIASRLVRILGTFETPTGVDDARTLADGKKMKTKLNWILNQGQTLDFFAYNLGSSALTTGAIVSAQGHANLWPR